MFSISLTSILGGLTWFYNTNTTIISLIVGAVIAFIVFSLIVKVIR